MYELWFLRGENEAVAECAKVGVFPTEALAKRHAWEIGIGASYRVCPVTPPVVSHEPLAARMLSPAALDETEALVDLWAG